MKKTFEIEGMSCNHCVHAVRTALAEIDGISVDHVEIGSATIVIDDPNFNVAALRGAIEEEGYKVAGELTS